MHSFGQAAWRSGSNHLFPVLQVLHQFSMGFMGSLQVLFQELQARLLPETVIVLFDNIPDFSDNRRIHLLSITV